MAKKHRSKKNSNPKKKKYKVTNWPEYNKALVNRGNISLLISPDIEKAWFPQPGVKQKGGQVQYSDYAIEMGLSLRVMFSLTLRTTQGFLTGIAELAELTIPIPCYSTFSRRGKSLHIEPLKRSTNEPVYLIVDSTGLKIYGEGEWLTEKHNAKRRKTWRKLHLAVDETGFIKSSELTTQSVDDAQTVPALLSQIEENIEVFCADGAYDRTSIYQALKTHNGGTLPEILVPPREDGVMSVQGDTQRDKHLAFIKKHGRDAWEANSGYTMQSKAENAMYRYKTLIGRKLKAREFNNQKTESKVGVKVMNWMTTLGMPISVPVS